MSKRRLDAKAAASAEPETRVSKRARITRLLEEYERVKLPKRQTDLFFNESIDKSTDYALPRELRNLIETYDVPCERVPDIKQKCFRGEYIHDFPLDNNNSAGDVKSGLLDCQDYCRQQVYNWWHNEVIPSVLYINGFRFSNMTAPLDQNWQGDRFWNKDYTDPLPFMLAVYNEDQNVQDILIEYKISDPTETARMQQIAGPLRSLRVKLETNSIVPWISNAEFASVSMEDDNDNRIVIHILRVRPYREAPDIFEVDN